MPGVAVVDMNDAICGKDSCPAVVGNIVVWRDNHHLTATYALALAPRLAKAAGF
ncbi:SGNH hydrolase domain-containing protein [Mesorhizobium sp. RIZ17]|uniref:SGNH hydrolase domain-containing protein n=1 Tax=Mesorhizobium sp. RIZ17 TaxID=3132743 RepID=UPI003DA99882